jgi:hypothetical protein
MRKTLLSILAIIFASGLFAQGFVPKSLQKETPSTKDPIHPNGVQGTLIWETDFDGADWSGTSNNGVPVPENAPTGWSLVDNTGNNFNWRWDTVGPRGIYTSDDEDCSIPAEPLASYSASNGFLMLESDHFNSNVNCVDFTEIDMDAYVQYDAGIDMSNIDAVYITFTEMNRFCCELNENSNAYVEISVDGGTTWTSFSVVNSTNVGSGNPNYTEINISDIAANQNNVMFRFHQIGLSHYYWLIDDIKFIEPHDYDIAMIDYWNSYLEYHEPTGTNDFTEGFYAYPWFFTQEFKGFHAAVYNYGANDLNNVNYEINITRNQVLQESFTTVHEATIASGTHDTLHMQQVWTPIAKGNYLIEHNVTHPNESFIYNNFVRKEFVITDSILSPVDFSKVNKEISPDDWLNYDEDGDGLGFKFNMPDPSLHDQNGNPDYYEFMGIEVNIGSNSGEELDLFINEEAKLVAKIYKYNPVSQTYDLHIASQLHTLSINDTSSVIYVPFVNDFGAYWFEGGEFLVAINMYGTYTDEFDRIQTWNIMGVDESVQKFSEQSCVTVNSTIETGNDVGWVLEGAAIALDIQYSDLYTSIENVNNQEIKLYPNPTTGKFSIVNIETGTIYVKNMAGQIVYTGELSNNQMDISDQPDGMYFIEVRNGSELFTGRVIKQ